MSRVRTSTRNASHEGIVRLSLALSLYCLVAIYPPQGLGLQVSVAQTEPGESPKSRLTSDSAEARLNLGKALIQEKRYTEAMWQLLEAWRLSPKDVRVIGALSFVFDQLGDSAGAVSWLTNAVQLVSDNSELHVFLGSHQYKAGQYQEAWASYRKAEQLNPASSAAHYGLGLALLKMDSPSRQPEAVVEFKAALRFDPRNARAYLQLGRLAFKENNLDSAARYLEKAQRLDPSLADAPAELGAVYRRQQKLSDAQTAYRAAIRLDPHMSSALYGLAQVLEARGLKHEAQAYFEQVGRLQKPEGLQAQALIQNARGLQAMSQGRLDDAVTCFREELSLHPDAQSAYDLGKALLQQGSTQEAIKYLRIATQTSPSLPGAQVDLANALREIGDPSADEERQKAQLLESLLVPKEQKQSPSHDAAVEQYNSAVSLMRQDKLTQAVDAFHVSLKLDPDFVESHYALGVLLMRMGDKFDAKQEFATVVRLNPENANAHNNLGALLAQEQNYAEAIGHILEVLRLNPKDGKARINLSNIFIAEGDVEAAIGQLLAATQLMPDDALLFSYLGRAQFRANNIPAAILSFRKALELDPHLASAHSGLGEALVVLGQKSEAREQFNSALGLDPDNADAHFQLAKLAQQQGHPEDASTHFQEAVRLKPGNLEAHVELGKTYVQLKNTAAAEKEFRAALEVNPGMQQAIYGLARLLNETGRASEAKPYFEHFEQLLNSASEKDLVPKLNAEGNEFRKAGRLQEAGESYRKALAIDPSSYELAYNLGLSLVGQGRLTEAIKSFRQAAQLRPSSLLAQDALVLALEKLGDPSAPEERHREELLKSFVPPMADEGAPKQDLAIAHE